MPRYECGFCQKQVCGNCILSELLNEAMQIRNEMVELGKDSATRMAWGL